MKRYDICEGCNAFWPSALKEGRFICLKDDKIEKNNNIEVKIMGKIKFINSPVPENCIYKMEQLVLNQDEKSKSL